MPAVRLDDASYQLLSQRAEAEDRPLARVLRAAVQSYCDLSFDEARATVDRLRQEAAKHLDNAAHLQKLIDTRTKEKNRG